jgi:hypothetical protein
MKIFTDITTFEKTDDVLCILTSALAIDMIVLYLVNIGWIRSKALTKWYSTLKLSATMANVVIIMLFLMTSRYIYSYIFSTKSLLFYILLTVALQIVYDIGFTLFLSSPFCQENNVFQMFRDFLGTKAILGDSVVVILTCLYASFLAGFSLNYNIYHFLMILYIVPFNLYKKF